jgi:hypothetical protein
MERVVVRFFCIFAFMNTNNYTAMPRSMLREKRRRAGRKK